MDSSTHLIARFRFHVIDEFLRQPAMLPLQPWLELYPVVFCHFAALLAEGHTSHGFRVIDAFDQKLLVRCAAHAVFVLQPVRRGFTLANAYGWETLAGLNLLNWLHCGQWV